MIPVDAAESEFFAEPGMSSPSLVRTHLSNTLGDISFHISADLNTKNVNRRIIFYIPSYSYQSHKKNSNHPQIKKIIKLKKK